jgi:rhodanese-related sulfurtransferase
VAGNGRALGYGLLGLALLALVILLPRLVRRLRNAPWGWISTHELKRRLDVGAPITVVDVRAAEEFDGPLGHIPGARNLPLPELTRAPDELPGAGERPIVLVCTTDKRSAKAAEVLRTAGIRDVLVLRGGMTEWRRDAVGASTTVPIGARP